MTFELLTVSSHHMTPAQLDAVIALCSGVFEMDYSYYMNLCPDRVHILGYDDVRLVSHALWMERRMRVGDGPWLCAAYIEGVATHADYRRRGYGSAVMRRLHQEIAGYALGALSPAEPEWYESLGWVRWQGRLLIDQDGDVKATPDDVAMVYRTPRSGPWDIRAPLTAEWRPFELW